MDANEKLIWAAGFFDGEGYIRVAKASPGRAVGHLKVNITQVIREPLELFRELFGGGIYTAPRGSASRQHADRWEAVSATAARALEAMLPYLVVKREHAEIALAYQALVIPRRRPVPEDVLQAREVQRQRLIALSSRISRPLSTSERSLAVFTPKRE